MITRPFLKDEIVLLQLLKERQTIALQEIIDLYQRGLCYFASGILNNSQVAEELVNDAYLKVWNREAHFDTLNELRSYLYVTVKNSCLDYLKSPKNKQLDGLDLEHSVIPSEEDIEARIIYAELLSFLHQQVDKLPEKQKQTFLMSFFEDMSTEEIAEKLGISKNAVFINKHEALKTIKLILKKKSTVLYLLFCTYFIY